MRCAVSAVALNRGVPTDLIVTDVKGGDGASTRRAVPAEQTGERLCQVSAQQRCRALRAPPWGAARPVFSPRDRVAGTDGPGAHRALGPGPGPRPDEGDSSARFLAECLHPELENDEQTVHINDRHMREVSSAC